MFPGKVQDSFVNRLPDVHAPPVFVHAQVVDVECLDICQYIVIQMLLENTEGVALQAVVLIHGGEDRPAFIFQDLTQLFVRILSLTVFEQIWPAFVVDQGDLRQQFVDPFDIFF